MKFSEILDYLKDTSNSPFQESLDIWLHLTGKHPVLTSSLPNKLIPKLREILGKRKKGIPLPYITKTCYFFGEKLFIEKGVFIPRVDTETLIVAFMDYFKEKDRDFLVADVGTGSGNLALILKKNFPNAKIIATDLSFRALKVAQKNLKDVFLINCDLLHPFKDGIFDAIISNPPYIPSSQLEALPEEVKREPKLSLNGGKKGTKVIERLLKTAREKLKGGGLVFIELSPHVLKDTLTFSQKIGLKTLEIRKDLSGEVRVAVLKKPEL